MKSSYHCPIFVIGQQHCVYNFYCLASWCDNKVSPNREILPHNSCSIVIGISEHQAHTSGTSGTSGTHIGHSRILLYHCVYTLCVRTCLCTSFSHFCQPFSLATLRSRHQKILASCVRSSHLLRYARDQAEGIHHHYLRS